MGLSLWWGQISKDRVKIQELYEPAKRTR